MGQRNTPQKPSAYSPTLLMPSVSTAGARTRLELSIRLPLDTNTGDGTPPTASSAPAPVTAPLPQPLTPSPHLLVHLWREAGNHLGWQPRRARSLRLSR